MDIIHIRLRRAYALENYKNLTEEQRIKLIEDAMIVHSDPDD